MILLFPTLINFKSPEERKNFDIRRASLSPFQIAKRHLLTVTLIAATCSTLVVL